MSNDNQFKNRNKIKNSILLLFYISTLTSVLHLEALATPLNHQLSPWYMQLGDNRESTSVDTSSTSHQTRRDGTLQASANKICIEPNREIYQQFVNIYNRSFADRYDELQRWKLFDDSFKRTIIFNDILESAFTRAPSPPIYMYSYIKSNELLYPDINDCELAHIKYTITGIFDLIDKNEFALALHNLKQANKDYPLLSGEAMKQACHILLVRLHDRATEDWIDKWFNWPKYFKKLAAYNYNQRQLQQLSRSGLASQLELYSFVHPKFYKDIRFNEASLNKTVENEKIHRDFKTVNVGKDLQISGPEKTERIDLFRRRWTMARLINDKLTNSNQFSLLLNPTANQNYEESARASRLSSDCELSRSASNLVILTRFSDLSDQELVAYINDDPSYVKNNSRSVEYYKQLGLVTLNNDTKLELVNEILLRRKPNNNWSEEDKINFADQLISDLGLPIGSRVHSDRGDIDFYDVSRAFNKNYLLSTDPYRLRQAPEEETQKRRSIYMKNHPRISAWQLKENWNLTAEGKIQMLRLADISWDEIKFTLLKLCCLNRDQMKSLSNSNSTIRYLLSTQICQIDFTGASREQQDNQQNLRAMELFYYYLVYFNKHHQNHEVHLERFITFRKNLADMTKYSCERNVFLYHLLDSKKFDMSMIDDKVIDDINLDRFLYYDIESDKDVKKPKPEDGGSWLSSIFGGGNSDSKSKNRDSPYSGREGTIFIHSQRFFEPVHDRKTFTEASDDFVQGNRYNNNGQRYPSERLVDDNRYGSIIKQNTIKNKDNQNVAIDTSNVYNFVQNRYKLCVDMKIIEDSGSPQCRPFASNNESERQVEAPDYIDRQADKCSQYRNGLDLYPNGLNSVKVSAESASLISRASCRRRGANQDSWNY